MSEHYDFHYQPTGSGAISGQQVLEQTEDAINELGDYVNDNVGGAMDVAQQALETAQNAEQDAQTALDTANSFSSAIQSAQQDASTALSTAQTAQTTASNANNTAIQAQQDASSAVTTANNASRQVSTLSGTVTALGQRVTTAEGNIGQNTSDITALGQRVTTAEGNITTLQNDVSIAQGNASSAMATAGQVKQQAFVFRYSSTVLVASSTNSNALLDNTDNLKAGDKVIDSSGVLFSITAIDTANSTFTVGTALIDLANDSDVVHKSGNETISGNKTFSYNVTLYNSSASVNPVALFFKNKKVVMGSTTDIGSQNIAFRDSADTNLSVLKTSCESVGNTSFEISVYNKDSNNQTVSGGMLISQTRANTYITPTTDNAVLFGSTGRRWSKIYGTEYYYGSNNVEFSTKFVTTDTAQTISGNKTFGNGTLIVDNITGSNVHGEIKLNGSRSGYIVADNASDGVFNSTECGVSILLQDAGKPLHIGAYKTDSNGRVFVDNTNKNPVLSITSGLIRTSTLVPENDTVNPMFRILSELNYANGNPSKTLDVRFIQYDNASGSNAIYSNDDGKTSLGVSSKKWSDVFTYNVNAVEPSSLSLPSGNANDVIDISSYITDLSGGINEYIAPVNGWITVTCLGCTGIKFSISNFMANGSYRENPNQISSMIPICKNQKVGIYIYGSSPTIQAARFIPCQGNV